MQIRPLRDEVITFVNLWLFESLPTVQYVWSFADLSHRDGMIDALYMMGDLNDIFVMTHHIKNIAYFI